MNQISKHRLSGKMEKKKETRERRSLHGEAKQRLRDTKGPLECDRYETITVQERQREKKKTPGRIVNKRSAAKGLREKWVNVENASRLRLTQIEETQQATHILPRRLRHVGKAFEKSGSVPAAPPQGHAAVKKKNGCQVEHFATCRTLPVKSNGH